MGLTTARVSVDVTHCGCKYRMLQKSQYTYYFESLCMPTALVILFFLFGGRDESNDMAIHCIYWTFKSRQTNDAISCP